MPVLDPFVYVQKKLDSNKVPGSLDVPVRPDLCASLREVLDDPRESAVEATMNLQQAARAALMQCVRSLNR